MNNAPFYVGQPIVALRNGCGIKKGNIYTCSGCFQKMCCGEWGIMIKEFPKTTQGKATCTSCGGNYYNSQLLYRTGPAKYFDPITEQYADITAEIAAGADSTDEKPDVVK